VLADNNTSRLHFIGIETVKKVFSNAVEMLYVFHLFKKRPE
jgi:hypothetical protein